MSPKRRRSPPRPRLPRAEREAQLWAVLEGFKARGEPCYPELFCEKAGVSKSTLGRFDDLAVAVWLYGKETWPEKMKGRPPSRLRPGPGRQTDPQMEREHAKWKREVPKLRGALREARVRIQEVQSELNQVREKLALRERLVEVLVQRAAEEGTGAAQDIERILRSEKM